ncbi:MAG: CYTH domain-containing protein [Synechococcales cyanobacterium M58_A2018_015]|nr:CYTH domain-containing protein [Synechococcales cyanobacterium M58_A2018_015]
MGVEIERKFLVIGDGWRALGTGVLYRQGYLVASPRCSVRVRVVGEQGFITIKGATQGVSRSEFEYVIPLRDAAELLDTLCQRPLIEKIRYRIPQDGVVWEVDEFLGENAGLIVAEVELTDPEQPLLLPEWIGSEVSADPRYFNVNLAQRPFREWGNTL